MVEDITENKKAEEALHHSEERFRMLASCSPVGIFVATNDGNVVYVNEAFRRLTGLAKEKHRDEGWADAVHPDDRRRVLDQWRRTVKKQGTFEIEFRLMSKDGKIRWVSSEAVLLKDNSGKATGFLGALSDITELKRAEMGLLAKQSELKSLALELSLAEERERRRIAAGIHDDIGQKLVLAKLELQMFMRYSGDSKTPAPKGPASLDGVCATIDKAIEDCHSLTFELSNPALYELNFEAALEQWLYEQVQKKHGIECQVAVKGKAVQPTEELKVTLFRAIREMAVNVVKHAKATALCVSIEQVADNVQVSLSDNGTGFAAEAAGTALSMDKTGGFGLFNIKERLEHLGGNMKIQSVPGKGTRITLTAPLEKQGIIE